MGRIKPGARPEISGKVGPVVYSSWKGTPVVKALPAVRKRSPTKLQLGQRQKFVISGRFMKAAREIIEFAYRDHHQQMTASNSAQAIILKQAFTGVYPAQQLDYSKIIMATGKLPGALSAYVESISGGIRFHWMDNSGDGTAKPSDRAILIVYCPADNLCVYDHVNNARGSLSGTLTLPLFKGKAVHTWLSFVSNSGKDTALSIYTGSLVVN